MVWYSLAIGGVVGSGKHEHGDKGALGGTKSIGKEEESGAKGLFSAFGHQVWLYLGVNVGFGEVVGPFFTTGPMIGRDPDWAIGGGIHIGKRFGLGVVVPVIAALRAASNHSDKAAMILDQGGTYLAQAVDTMQKIGVGGLERLATDPSCVAASAMMLGVTMAHNPNVMDDLKKTYSRTKSNIVDKLYKI